MSETNGSQHPPGRDYLRVEDLEGLRHLLFTPRRPVEGLYSGRHSSRQRGYSVEFNDYREYTPGDEVGKIDWKVYGRSDKLFIKLFEHQSDMSVHLLIDGSASMGYRGSPAGRTPLFRRQAVEGRRAERKLSKYDQACLMAGAVGFLVIQNQDKVGFGIARGGLEHAHRPLGTYAHLDNILRSMERVKPRGFAALAEAIETFINESNRKGVLIVFSDLFDDQNDVLKALARFTHRGTEVIVFHILHPDELELPEFGQVIVTDSETRQEVRLNVDDVRAVYKRHLREFMDGWAAALTNRGIDYNLVSTETPYNVALEKYLSRRPKMKH